MKAARAAAPQAQPVAEWQARAIGETEWYRVDADMAEAFKAHPDKREVRALYAAPERADDRVRQGARLSADDVQWVTNDIAELGVKIGNQFFFLYKGGSLVYEGLHDDGSPMHWRPVRKREFGECAHPINYDNPALIGTVSLDDSDEWQKLPATKGQS